jgi:hypothetical protein
MNTTVLTLVRLGVTALVAGLSDAMIYYPHQYWMPIVVTAAAAIGIHVIPSIGQASSNPPATTPKQPPFTGA